MHASRFDEIARRVAERIPPRGKGQEARGPSDGSPPPDWPHSWTAGRVAIALCALAVAVLAVVLHAASPGSPCDAPGCGPSMRAPTSAATGAAKPTSVVLLAVETPASRPDVIVADVGDGGVPTPASVDGCAAPGCQSPPLAVCGPDQYAVAQSASGGLTYSAPSALRQDAQATSCRDHSWQLPAAAANVDDPLGWCDLSPLGCVSGTGGPCAAGERGCVPYAAANPLDRCASSGGCAIDPTDTSAPYAGVPGGLDAPTTQDSSCRGSTACTDIFGPSGGDTGDTMDPYANDPFAGSGDPSGHPACRTDPSWC